MSNLIDEKGNEIGHPEQFDMSIYEEAIKRSSALDNSCKTSLKLKKKSWLKEYLDINCDSKIEAHNSEIDIKNVCKKILEEADNRFNYSTSVCSILEDIIKDLGIKL